MNEKRMFFPKQGEGNFYLKSIWVGLLLLVPFFYANADKTQALIAEEKNEQLMEDAVQADRTIVGVVVDTDGAPMPGVTVFIKGTTIGTITDIDGNYHLKVEKSDAILVFSFIGMQTQEVPVEGKSEISVTLQSSLEMLEDIVVVGYGVQKKESVVGSISQAKGEDLLKAGGVTSVSEALQGRLPGVTTIYSNGLPGESDPQIFIRGQSSWNNGGQPLILVDGVERSMGDIDLNEIEQISVLKDASATAVFGVKGGSGVILLTTKRGKTGKAQLSISGNSTMKMVSKLPNKLDSYESAMVANESIMRELAYQPLSWNAYVPMQIANKYRNPSSVEESYIYPNVNWEDVLLKDYAMDYRVNLSVRGGSDFAKYFGSLSYQSVSDILDGKKYSNGKGYESEFSYHRFNYRSNLDFEITNTTTFSVNLSGFLGIQNKPHGTTSQAVGGIYSMAPSLFTPVYPDGYYGRHESGIYDFNNPIVSLTNTGYETSNKFQVNSDFSLKQKLDFVTKGLTFKATLSYDNDISTLQKLNDPNVADLPNVVYREYDIDGNERIISGPGINDFDFVVQPWNLGNNSVTDKTRLRRLNYEFSFNYNRVFAAKHYVTLLGLFKREEFAKGNGFPVHREDWVSRLTYNYDTRYFIDASGAYNGSEKFGPGYRFDVFPSVALGWMASNESFMSHMDWLDKLKFKGSFGLVGDDKAGARFLYLGQWGLGGSAYLNSSQFDGKSPYTMYKETVVGNPDLQWETSLKSNVGVEVSILKNMITADFDYFTEDRDNILLLGGWRSVPDLYGNTPAAANSGRVKVKGYELALGFNYKFGNGINLWSNFNLTHAKDEIIAREDPELAPFYQKSAGYPIGQRREAIAGDIMQSWDDIYMATRLQSGQANRRIGYYDLVDFNGDGAFSNTYDYAPFGYTDRPETTWNLTTGASYKGINIMAQFYGTQNAMRNYATNSFNKQTRLFYEHRTNYWSTDNPTGTQTLDPWSLVQANTEPANGLYDASLVRLKTVELSYDIPKKVCEKIGISKLRLFANGNNLYLWTDMPDDREFNSTDQQYTAGKGDYPTMKRFNFGFNLNF